MAYRKEKFLVGEFYHLYNRGTEKRKIYLDKKDYEHFMHLMYVCNSEKSLELRNIKEDFNRKKILVNIGAFCLMPNHYHFLITEVSEGGISKYMLKLMTAYTMYFNKKYERSGKLYEGKFKSTYANTDKYLKYLYSYIHLNPAKILDKNWKSKRNKSIKELLNYVFDYPYSSIKEYKIGKFYILNTEKFPKYFKSINGHKKELFEWLNFNN